ncbi:MAG: 3-oxoacyl-[acyl-carrier-protein] reductase [Candidatus Omnitrophica bacterium]|nr:3-oxoacyl-[acyl-carrier-protein] reductase [Candidatus Omnitrophota bacterium]
MNLKGKVAIVTGGGRGIGRAIVLKLASLGCNVAFNYVKNKEAAASLEKEVQKLGVKCQSRSVDIKDFAKVKEWVDFIKEEFGGLDILVNNAGIIVDKALMLMSEEDWNSVIDTNLNGMFNASRAVIVTFLKQKSGHVINISSVSGLIGLPRQTNYSASKGAMNAFTKSLAKEVAAYGIKVNAIAPGFIETEMLSEFSDEQKQKILDMIPLGRMGSVHDVTGCVEFLLSDAAQYITGQIIQIDGGLAIR